MSGKAMRVFGAVVVVAFGVVLYLVLKGSADESVTSSAAMGVPVVVVEGGEPKGGVQELTYNAGEPIRFRVRSDVADEIHLHGYDVAKDVDAGGTAEFEVPADIPGIFEVELEGREEQIARVTVGPQ